MKLKSNISLILKFMLLASLGLSWIVADSVTLTANSHDLAEWLTLHPVIRSMGQWLPPVFTLRMLFVLLGWSIFIDSYEKPHLRSIYYLIVGLMILPIAPPIEFFRGNLADWNYRQQFFLLILYGVGLLFLARLRNKYLSRGIHLIALPFAAWGGYSGYSHMASFQFDVRFGMGFILFISLSMVSVIWEIYNDR